MKDDATLGQARQLVASHRREGILCPCCDLFVKTYRRKLNSSMAYCLLLIDRYFRTPRREPWLHVESYLKTIPNIPAALRGDFPKLRYWGFIEPQPGLREDGSNRVGYYRITHLGQEFVAGRAKAKSHVLIDNQEALGFEGDYLTIAQALGAKFNYRELMQA